MSFCYNENVFIRGYVKVFRPISQGYVKSTCCVLHILYIYVIVVGGTTLLSNPDKTNP